MAAGLNQMVARQSKMAIKNYNTEHKITEKAMAPALLPGKYHGRRSLVGCSPWGLTESDMTERLSSSSNTQVKAHTRRPGSPHQTLP